MYSFVKGRRWRWKEGKGSQKVSHQKEHQTRGFQTNSPQKQRAFTLNEDNQKRTLSVKKLRNLQDLAQLLRRETIHP